MRLFFGVLCALLIFEGCAAVKDAIKIDEQEYAQTSAQIAASPLLAAVPDEYKIPATAAATWLLCFCRNLYRRYKQRKAAERAANKDTPAPSLPNPMIDD